MALVTVFIRHLLAIPCTTKDDAGKKKKKNFHDLKYKPQTVSHKKYPVIATAPAHYSVTNKCIFIDA